MWTNARQWTSPTVIPEEMSRGFFRSSEWKNSMLCCVALRYVKQLTRVIFHTAVRIQKICRNSLHCSIFQMIFTSTVGTSEIVFLIEYVCNLEKLRFVYIQLVITLTASKNTNNYRWRFQKIGSWFKLFEEQSILLETRRLIGINYAWSVT